jgi:protein TonB
MATIFSIFRKSEGLEEIIFKDRNKEYGSYALRKEQNSSLNQSSLITLGIAFIICILLIQQGKHEVVKIVKDTTTIQAVFTSANLDPPLIKFPSPRDGMPKLKISDFLMPIVVEKVTDPTLEIGPNPDFPTTAGLNPSIGFGTDSQGQDPVPVEINNWVYNVPEMPTFNGGDLIEFSKWVQRNVIYPQSAIEQDLEGRVTVEFIIDKKGQIEEIKIMRGVDPLLDNEALRVLKMSPLWKPGKQNGDPVRVKLVLPIIFKLNK